MYNSYEITLNLRGFCLMVTVSMTTICRRSRIITQGYREYLCGTLYRTVLSSIVQCERLLILKVKTHPPTMPGALLTLSDQPLLTRSAKLRDR